METPCQQTLVLARGDPRYPQRLLELDHPPEVLWATGRLELLQKPMIAIVGSRPCTHAGAHDAEAFAHAFARMGFCVVSGLALGVDAAAHRGALRGPASSVAVLGTGIDGDYPPRNADLARELRQRGCVITEFPPGTPPLPGNFPQRNRLISGLALGVLVVEAAENSGSLITARAAASQGRDVFALPGSIHAPLSKGCHKLIREGAKLVDTAQHVVEDLGWKGEGHAQAALPLEAPEPGDMSEDPSPVLKALGHVPMSMDQVALLTGLPIGRIAAELTRLEMARRVRSLPGGWFERALPGAA